MAFDNLTIAEAHSTKILFIFSLQATVRPAIERIWLPIPFLPLPWSSIILILSEPAFADSAQEGLKILEASEIHLIITDQRMPTTTGTEFLESVAEKYPDPPRIPLTGYAEHQRRVGCHK